MIPTSGAVIPWKFVLGPTTPPFACPPSGTMKSATVVVRLPEWKAAA
jgi:hypothetical protein